MPALPVNPMTMKMVPSVPMLMDVSMTMTIFAMLMLTTLTPLVVTNVYAKMIALDVLTSTSVPPEPIIASPSTVLTTTVIFQGHQYVSITTKVSLVIVHGVSGLKKVESVSM